MSIQRLGPYRVVRKIGRGGMGTVYEGVCQQTGEPAAIKTLAHALADDEGFRERFEAEIETLRKLNHPGIVRLLGYGEQDGTLFYAMELVEGVSLEDELRRGRRFEWPQVTRWAVEICRALRHAHDRGIVHRDLKPGNLLLAADGHVKLSDFGIARLFGYQRLTLAGSVVGTAEYMAPEQAEGRPIDPRADLYSLGGVVYALLAQRAPFQAASLVDMLQMQRSAVPEPLAKYAPDTPAELQSVVAQLLEKDPERRPPNAGVLGRRLETMLQELMPLPETLALQARSSPSVEPALGAAVEEDRAAELAPTRVASGIQPAADQAITSGSNQSAGAAAPISHHFDAAAGSPPEAVGPLGDGIAAPRARFTAIGQHELDREDVLPKQRALISLQTWVLGLSLIAVAATIGWVLQPPTADSLYGRIAARAGDGSVEALLDVEGQIDDFLMRFPRDPRSEQLRKYAREIQLYHLERKFERRAAGLIHGEILLPAEHAYLEALQCARTEPERAAAKLQALIDLFNHRADPGGPVGECVELARRRLHRLQEQISAQAAQSLALLEDRLDRADQLAARDPARARAMRQAVIELYGDKPWAAEAVERARAAMKSSSNPTTERKNTN